MAFWTDRWPAFEILSRWDRRLVDLPEGRGVEYQGPHGAVLGGPPGGDDNPDLAVMDWAPPGWLADLYAVHRGLGPWWGMRSPGLPDRWSRHAVLPWSSVTPLTRHIRFGEEDITFDPADCVLFAPDGVGGGWVFEGRGEYRIRRFDAGSHALSAPVERHTMLADLVSGWIASPP